MNLSLFRNRSFLLYTIGNAVSTIGDVFLSVCLALYMLKITGSAMKFASVMAVSMIPQLLLGPFAGSIVDRLDKKRILMVLDLLRGTFLTGIFALSLNVAISEVHIYAIVFFEALCQSFYVPASASVFPLILDKSELIDANLLERMIVEISNIIAPALAALIYGISGIGIIIFIDGISFFVSSACELFLKLKEVERKNSESSLMKNVIEGFKLYKDIEILSISLNGMLTHLLIFPFILIGVPFLMKEVFNTSDIQYGMVQSVYTTGTLLTFMTVPLVNKYFKELKALNAGMYGMLSAICLTFLISQGDIFSSFMNNAFAVQIFFSSIMFLFSLSFSTYGVFYSTFNQRKIPPEFLGRFYSMLIMLFAGGRIIGFKIYGALFDSRLFFIASLTAVVGMILKLLLNAFLKPNDIVSS